MKNVLIIMGTRPEAIKIAPIVLAMREADSGLRPEVCLTGQHPQIAREALEVFGVAPDRHLDCVRPGGDLCVTSATVIEAVGRLIDDCRPDAVLVQGDTLSTLAGAWAACLRRVPVAHVEAGLRSGRMDDPFPEEMSRRLLAQMATWNFAPTDAAVRSLFAEGVDPERVCQVGNTVVDAIRIVRSRIGPAPASEHRTVLVSVHRRENWGEPLARVCSAIRTLAERHADWRFVFSLHPNPALQDQIRGQLGGIDTVELVPFPPYDAWVRRLLDCDLILSDSGGMQEEGCALGRPVLILRETTERPECIEAGSALLIGTRTDAIVQQCTRVMCEPDVYARMAQPRDVFGDGYAAQRVVSEMQASLTGAGRRRVVPGTRRPAALSGRRKT